MILFPPAKINLGLNVLFKRQDGYHEMESCMYQIPFYDILEIIKSDSFKFYQSGLKVNSKEEENLVVKAFRLMQSNFSIGNVYIHLFKSIPMGAGLGGGSSNAAYVILGLNDLFNLNLSLNHMRSLSMELGSDCPFFIEKEAKIVTGRGEIFKNVNIDLEGKFLKIVNPRIHISTKDAYNRLNDFNNYSIEKVINKPIEKWKKELKNSFEYSAFKNYPEIELIKNKLYMEGAIYASMSGSGSTIYGLYNKQPKFSFDKKYEKIFVL